MTDSSNDNNRHVILEGMVNKSFGLIKVWKKRYFILDHKSIRYFNNPTCETLIRVIPLRKVVKVSKDDRKPGAFVIDTVGPEIHCVVSSDAEAERWVAGITTNVELLK